MATLSKKDKDKNKNKKNKELMISGYKDKRSRPGLHYGTDDLVPVYGKDGKILYWREGTVDIKRT